MPFLSFGAYKQREAEKKAADQAAFEESRRNWCSRSRRSDTSAGTDSNQVSLGPYVERGMASPGRGTTRRPDEGRDVFLNNNIWLAMVFTLMFLSSIFGLLFLLAWLEPSRRMGSVPHRARPVVRGARQGASGPGPAPVPLAQNSARFDVLRRLLPG